MLITGFLFGTTTVFVLTSALAWALAIAQVCDAACFGHVAIFSGSGLLALVRRRRPYNERGSWQTPFLGLK
jgi:hypothetical protein